MGSQSGRGSTQRSPSGAVLLEESGTNTIPCAYCGHPLGQHLGWWGYREWNDGQTQLFNQGIGGGKCRLTGCECKGFIKPMKAKGVNDE